MSRIKRSYNLENKIYTRWEDKKLIQINNKYFASICGASVYIIDSETGSNYFVLNEDTGLEESMYDVAIDPYFRFAFTSHHSLLIQCWVPSKGNWIPVKAFKFPVNTPASLKLTDDQQILVAASNNGSAYFYSVKDFTLIGKANICKGGICNIMNDSVGNVWFGTIQGGLSYVNINTLKGKVFTDKGQSHISTVTGLAETEDFIFTASPDQSMHVFDKKCNHITFIPVQYDINSMIRDPEHENSLYCATDDGIKRVTYTMSGSRIKKVSNSVCNQLLFFDTLYMFFESGVLCPLDGENSFSSLILTLDSVFDVVYNSNFDYVACATTSKDIHIISQSNRVYILSGHDNCPLTLASQNNLLLSGSKDKTAILWSLEELQMRTRFVGHTDIISAVGFVPKTNYILTASNDNTVKLWNIVDGVQDSSLATIVAHQKDINSLAVSIDGSLFATASRDKTAKLFSIDGTNISHVRTFIGHKGAIWSLVFSPVDRTLATCGRDNSVRIWNIDDGACISTLNEFASPVMRVQFLSHGLQVAAAESNGDIKILRVKTGATDIHLTGSHKNGVYGLSSSHDENFLVSGDSNGVLCVWKDNTIETLQKEQEEKDKVSQLQVDLDMAMKQGDFIKALQIVIELGMPHKARLVIRRIAEMREFKQLKTYFSDLKDMTIFERWFEYVSKWSTNGKWVDDANTVLTSMLETKSINFFIKHRFDLQEKIDSIIPYLERHFSRIEKLSTSVYMVDYMVDSVDFN